jgi:hypothetical protein
MFLPLQASAHGPGKDAGQLGIKCLLQEFVFVTEEADLEG